MSLIDCTDYAALLLNDTPLIDVRAPIEFSSGALPNAINLPILSNQEREIVGTCYKQHGKSQAIAIAEEMVSGENREQKIDQWATFYHEHPNAVIYCARGGLRSKTAQEWLHNIGIDLPRVHLGYKAIRNFLLNTINDAIQHSMLIVSGNTGSGKTELLHHFTNAIDLEGYANHRGSAFGRNVTDQPSQADFENRLAFAFLKGFHKNESFWLLEDEGHTLGKNYLPKGLYEQMATQPLIIIEEPIENRVERIRNEYVIAMRHHFITLFGEQQGNLNYENYLTQSLFTLQKRLGLERFHTLDSILKTAIKLQLSTGETSAHNDWIQVLLQDYYDPKYQYQLSKKQERVVFRGSFSEAEAFISDYTPSFH